MFNEQNEIQGDLRDEYQEIQEQELLAGAPEPGELSPEDEAEWFAQWCHDNGVTPEEMAEAQEAIEFEERCTVHGGSNWRGGYCDRWSTDAGRGPCVR